ncbi:kinesin-like protein KIFC3 [Halichondria panicea]|uniref:kinesin-like protein KIFC3 n=1 Tax=Halichondria panicea TaxID=6063 RepID=UPI00312BA5E3
MSRDRDRFMRPIQYLPHLATPTKTPREVMMDELGMGDNDPKDQTSSSGSDDESPVSSSVLRSFNSPLPVAQTEMKQMLRETQYKLRMAQSNLLQSEQGRERRLKIIKKTHSSALSLKQALIQDLQDIIAEREENINELETQLRGCSCEHVLDKAIKTEVSPCNGLERLVLQLSRLQKDHVALEGRYEQVSAELRHVQSEKENLHDELMMTKDMPFKLKSPANPMSSALAQQVREMQKRVAQLEEERLVAQSRADIEKELQIRVTDLKTELRAVAKDRDHLNVKHKIEIACLNNHVESLKADSSKKNKEEMEKVHTLQQILSQLESQNESLSSELRATRDKITSHSLLHQEALSSLNFQLAKEKEISGALRKEKAVRESDLQNTQQKLSDLAMLSKELEDNNDQLDTECGNLRDRLSLLEQQQARDAAALSRLSQLRHTLSKVSSSASSVKTCISDFKNTALTVNRCMQQDIAQASKKITRQIRHVSAKNVSLVSKYRHEMGLRKKLHNQLVELRGNIRVFCRVRPVIAEDGTGSQAELVVIPDSDDNGVVRVRSRGTWKTFDLDRVFSIGSRQEEVFSEVKALVTSCMDGYNVCIFAYGQTGSGKTFTMQGPSSNPGLNQRALQELFHLVEERHTDYDYSIVVSVLEIYNECVRDLLSVDPTHKLDIKQGSDGVYVPGLTQVAVSQLEEVNEVFTLGHENRSTGATKMNIQSSRSHALLCIIVMGLNRTTGVQTIGKLNLIDLAGSERLDKSGSDGMRLEEAKHINKSLSSLGDVIHHLRAKSSHTPYRNSKLTYLLQDSLCGDSKTLMMVQVSPVEKNAGESVCSLNFAQRVRVVELGQATKKTSTSTPKLKRTIL